MCILPRLLRRRVRRFGGRGGCFHHKNDSPNLGVPLVLLRHPQLVSVSRVMLRRGRFAPFFATRFFFH
jgi:hypothetical protein